MSNTQRETERDRKKERRERLNVYHPKRDTERQKQREERESQCLTRDPPQRPHWDETRHSKTIHVIKRQRKEKKERKKKDNARLKTHETVCLKKLSRYILSAYSKMANNIDTIHQTIGQSLT